MSETATQLIQAFITLPPNERYAVLMELARISGADGGPLSENEFACAGEEIFAMYDAEEDEHGQAQTR